MIVPKFKKFYLNYMNGTLPYKREQDPFDENHYVYLKEHNETIENRKLT